MRPRPQRILVTTASFVRAVVGVVFGVAVAGGSASAAPEPAIELAYEAPPGCPSRGELVEQIGRRVPMAWRERADRRSFLVRIERLESGEFSGRLVVTRARRVPQMRDFRARTCKEVSSALAVFIAIALDPILDDDEGENGADREAVAEQESAAAPATEELGPPPAPRPDRPAVRSTVQRRHASDAWVWTSSVSLTYLRVPLDAWGSRVDAQLARPLGAHGFARRIAPGLRLSWGFSDFTAQSPEAGVAHFRLEAARASACASIDLAPLPLNITPCLGFELGSLAASSREISHVGYVSAGWAATAGLVRVAWSLLPWLSLEAELGAEAPSTRPSFALNDPVRLVYRPPPLVYTTGLGLAVSVRFR